MTSAGEFYWDKPVKLSSLRYKGVTVFRTFGSFYLKSFGSTDDVEKLKRVS